jgi:hypothetical protein
MATAKAKPSKLADIIKYRRQQGGGVAGSLAGGIKEKFKEKFDPRQIFDQQGILTALFPGLKAFKATTGVSQELKNKITPASSTSFEEIIPTLEKINANTRIISKNMMVLPAMHRDINVMRQNIGKLVKLRGANAATKADMYFMKSKEREAAYEEQFKRTPTRITSGTNTSNIEGEREDGGGSILSNFASGIIGAIVSLGKAITKAFSTLAGIVKSLLIQLGQAIFRVIIKALGTFLVTAITDFIKNLGLSALIFKLIRLVLRPVLWPLAIAAAAYVAASYLRENPFSSIDEGQIGLAGETLPMPAMKAGEELTAGIKLTKEIGGQKGRAMDPKEFLNVKEEDSTYTKATYDDIKSGKKKVYMLYFPGLIQRAPIALTDSEAQDLGKKYQALISLLKHRKTESNKDKPDPEQVSHLDNLIRDVTVNIRKIYRDTYVNSKKPQILQREEVKSFIDMMDRKIKYPEMGPIESRVAQKVDETFEGLKDLNTGDLAPDFREAQKNLQAEIGKIRIDPSEFTPSLQAPPGGTGSGQQIQQKTGDVKDGKQSSLLNGQTDIKVSSLSTQRGTSSVTHMPELATPWNMDLIENLLTGPRAMIG